ncbi:DNA-binding FrmR family transcriptional regulator [Aequitasia blattaphilus]|uniref:Metal-sensing transcriptional repressor n=1 Tax=Aequitasia blattaphilus TaxID=2949332 RepID=A0ABT1E8T8_9FIRM|nr:metal-sensing transcriptional repressor [Aequitasia blattaphilus]MCP1102241.1 metal-sensing transcriptional repressor [Aequitasia blattaphilus]MCR8614881.1 metal-sensing transcriptional repressor [Aequitasia blattaphilus]
MEQIHDMQDKKAIIHRLSRAIGHLDSVRTMVLNDKDCTEILIQLAAVRSALAGTGKTILKDHIHNCIAEAVENGDQKKIDALDEAIDQFIK